MKDKIFLFDSFKLAQSMLGKASEIINAIYVICTLCKLIFPVSYSITLLLLAKGRVCSTK